MLSKLQDELEKVMHKDYAYLIVAVIYTLLMYIPILLVAHLYSFIPFIFISIFTFENIRNHSFGFHMGSNLSCFLISVPILFTVAYISQQTIESYLWVAFLLCLISMKNIYAKAPLKWEDTPLNQRWYNCKPFCDIADVFKVNRKKFDVSNDYKWHRNKMLFWMWFSYLLSLLFFTVGQDLLCSYTLWNIIMVDLLLFINKD